MTAHFGVMIAGFLLLWLGAEGFVRGGARISSAAGISSVIVGLTFGAIATSLPELTVSWIASFTGAGAVALGNAAGSNIANTGLALGLGALIYPLAADKEILKYDFRYLLGASLLLVVFTFDMVFSRPEGLVLVAFFFIYILHIIKRHRVAAPLPVSGDSIVIPVFLFILGGSALFAGGRLAVSGTLALARALGISQAAAGLTIIALGTSLPEIAVLVAGSVRKAPEISLGTIVGSNIFNILLVGGGSAAINPIHINRAEALFQAPALLLFTLLLFGVMLAGRRISRYEGGFLLFCYAGYIALLFGVL